MGAGNLSVQWECFVDVEPQAMTLSALLYPLSSRNGSNSAVRTGSNGAVRGTLHTFSSFENGQGD